jgi:hypothetical protein
VRYARVREQGPEDPWVALYAAPAYAGQGRSGEAVRTGEEVVALFATDTSEGPAARAVLAEILWRFGQRDRAVAELTRYAAAYPQARDLARYDPRYAATREDPRLRNALRWPTGEGRGPTDRGAGGRSSHGRRPYFFMAASMRSTGMA